MWCKTVYSKKKHFLPLIKNTNISVISVLKSLWLFIEILFRDKNEGNCRKVVAGCDLCQKCKQGETYYGGMNSVVPEKPNELLYVNLIGPLAKGRGGATQLLVTIDAFSKYVSLYPLRRGTTNNILRCLTTKYFISAGKTTVILSDNDTYFTKKKWVNKLKEEGVQFTLWYIFLRKTSQNG
ncbi:hypothetical protein JTB14_010048 [Gonioctena quinquepunctata]|nr:hypothetical protein JTB14_010048 [Gonioctena quinquepunctata]